MLDIPISDDIAEAQDIEKPERVAYVYRLGESGIYKVGKTVDLERREKTFQTISTEQLALHARIETTNHTEVENFLKARLLSYRWLDGPGKDLYRAPRDVMDAAIEAARAFNSNTLPRLNEAKNLATVRSDGSVLTPSDVHKALYHELFEWRQAELLAQQEVRRIKAELMVTMGAASQLEGIATWVSQDRRLFDGKRFQLENPDLAAPYIESVHVRPFVPGW